MLMRAARAGDSGDSQWKNSEISLRRSALHSIKIWTVEFKSEHKSVITIPLNLRKVGGERWVSAARWRWSRRGSTVRAKMKMFLNNTSLGPRMIASSPSYGSHNKKDCQLKRIISLSYLIVPSAASYTQNVHESSPSLQY